MKLKTSKLTKVRTLNAIFSAVFEGKLPAGLRPVYQDKLHLPVGSPAFMFRLAVEIHLLNLAGVKITPVFSHSERIVTDLPDGKKVVSFQFGGLIEGRKEG